MKKFTYTGYHETTLTVELCGRKIYVDQVDGKFEVYSDGGSFGHFATLGKAVTFAEKQLVTLNKNNPL